jgi:hypothetical protein
VAPGVGHSDASKTSGYPDAIGSFLERNWN